MLKRAIPPMTMAFFAVYVLVGGIQAALFSDLSAAAGKAFSYLIQAALWAGLQRPAYIPLNLLLGAGAAAAVLWLEKKQAAREEKKP